MGAGRKTQTFYAGESVAWSPLSGDGSILTRNLVKDELGGVIFGCRHCTMQECLSKQLFGLPHGHFSYVRNIEEGLPLFLFNYSDRKLHGIYEAASHGRLLYDAYAWTDGGTGKTPSPAQVYIHIKMQCQPLTENQFKRIIADNYFSPQHFWFELDHNQTRALTALFKRSPGAIMLPPVLSCRKESFPPLSANKGAQSRNKLLTASPASKWKAVDRKGHPTTEASNPICKLEPSASIVNESKTGLVHKNCEDLRQCIPNRTSCAGFEETDSRGTISDWEELAEENAHNLSSGARLDGANLTSQEQQSSAEGLEKEEERVLLLLQKLAAERESLKPYSDAGSSREFDHNHENAEDVCISNSSTINYINGKLVAECKSLKPCPDAGSSRESDHNHEKTEDICIPISSTVNYINDKLVAERKSLKPCPDAGSSTEFDHNHENTEDVCIPISSTVNYINDKLVAERESLKPCPDAGSSREFDSNHENAEDVSIPISSTVNYINGKLVAEHESLKPCPYAGSSREFDHNHENTEDICIPISSTVSYTNSKNVEMMGTSGVDHGNDELVRVIEELKERTSNLEKQRAEQDHEMELLRNAFKDAGSKIQLLQDRIEELESKSALVVDESPDKSIEQYFGSEDVIYLIGGFNGHSWLSALDCFSPTFNILTPLKPMSCARSYASAAALDGLLYVFGGGDGDSWFNSVECYDQCHDEWTSCPSMLRAKGSLAGTTLNGKIYAIGGGNSVGGFSDVEMFDPMHGTWINCQSLISKRFAPAAAELNGVIYASGGYDGNAYLRSVERFDPREGSWTEAASMNIRRGCHSIAVFNEKIYCIGGYEGENMVSSIETFDPRLNIWEMGEPMMFERGYAATAVLGNAIVTLGGIKDDKVLADTVECYREGSGWTTTGWNCIGERCFFSAVVL